MSDRTNDGAPTARADNGPTRFDVHVDRHGVVNLRGELDAETAPGLATELDRLADDGGIVCVDCSDLEFCGAAGINVLFGAVRKLGTRGRLVIYDPSPSVSRLLDITGLDQFVDVAVSRVATAPPMTCTRGADHGASVPRAVVTGQFVARGSIDAG
jgi:anti-anti-sigma factor